MAKKPSYKELEAKAKGLRKELETRKKTAEELRFLKENIEQSKKEWETIFDSIAEGVFMVDDAYTISRANKGLATLLKRNVQEIVGCKCYELIHGLSKIPKMCPRPLVVKHRSPQSAEMWEFYLKRHLSIYYYPLVDEDGSVRNVVHLIRDVTEKKKIEQELKSRVSELATLYEFGLKVISTLDIQELLSFVTDTLYRTMGAGECSIFLWDGDKETLALKSSSYVPHEQIGRVKIRLGEGIIGWIAVNRSVVNLKDMKSDSRYEDRYGLIKRFFPKKRLSYLGIPLILGDKLLGVLSLLDKKGAPKFSTFDQSLAQSMGNQLSVALENSSLYQRLKESYLGTIRSLASAVEVRDPYTRGHSDSVARYSVMIAKALGLSYGEIELIEFAGILHDIGKIAIPMAILEKPSSLNPKELNNVKRHPSLSRQLLLPVRPLAKIIPWVYHHHERYDGKGYVDRLKGDDIPLGARILAVADTYSAMTSERPYRKAKDKEKALEELKRVAGKQLDPMIVKVFIEQLTKSHH